MSYIDISIIVFYLFTVLLVGIYFQKKASEGINSFFLANKKLPWWALGASGMASNLDISGTMINISLIYVLGIMGFFVEFRGGIVLILSFLMIFMGKWNKRANVMTLAEWMELRFGNNFEGKLARVITASAIILTSIAIVTYFAIGTGKFIAEILQLPNWFGIQSYIWASSIIILISMIYSVSSGLYGVVWTDVLQGFIILLLIIFVCYNVFNEYNLPNQIAISIPTSNGNFNYITTKSEWLSIIPSWNKYFPENSTYSIYNLLGVSILFYLLKTIIEGSGGTGGYMIQRYFAAKNEKEVGKLSLFWIFTLSFRWPFVVSIAVMGIVYNSVNINLIDDPEKTFPIVLNNLFPVGLKGLALAGVLAAGMSTFDSIVNSAASYWVKDIYQNFINKNATEKMLVFQSRLISVVIVILGLFISFNVSSINEIWSWLTMGLGSGLIIPLIVRWYWWRLNGYGYSAGVFCGMAAAIIQKLYAPALPEYLSFIIITLSSLSGLIFITFMTNPVDENIIYEFYKRTKPFGFWKPLYIYFDTKALNEIHSEHKRDIVSTFFAVAWQLSLAISMMVVVVKLWNVFFYSIIVFIISSIGLYFKWYKYLSNDNTN